jgi:hypothetical protein
MQQVRSRAGLESIVGTDQGKEMERAAAAEKEGDWSERARQIQGTDRDPVSS